MPGNGHAKLAPSSAYRWLSCPGSVELNESVVDTGSSYAEEGTAGHEIFAFAGRGTELNTFLGKRIHVEDGAPEGVEVTQELLDHVAEALEWVREYKEAHPRAVIFQEQKFEIGAYNFDLPPGVLYGTADFVAISPEELCIADLKLGFVNVVAPENEQLILYALGALSATGWIHDTIRIAILQPKTGAPKEVVYTAAQMDAFREAYAPGVKIAAEGGPLVASEEACRWCKAAGVCPEIKKATLALARREFSNLITLSGEEVAEILEKGTMIEQALKSVRAHALKLLEIDPNSIPGWKRVQGEKKRRWKDEDVAMEKFKASLPLDVIAPRSLVSPLQVETALGKALHDLIQKEHGGKNKQGKKVTKKACNEEAEEIVAPYAEKPDGFPTLVKDADARPALGPVFTAADVAALSGGPEDFGGTDEGSHYMNSKQGLAHLHLVPAKDQTLDVETID